MRLRSTALCVALLLAPACAMNDKDLCPESRGIRCATTPDCTRDSARGAPDFFFSASGFFDLNRSR